MGRTIRGNNKGRGFDYWKRRAISRICGHGKDVKQITARMERARARDKVKAGRFDELANKEAI